jgi:hypothetical protein
MQKNKSQSYSQKQSLFITFIFIFGGIFLILVVWSLISFTWTGFQEKTLWDWLDLFLLPAILLLFIPLVIRQMKQYQERNASLEREITRDLQREEAMMSYMELITVLMLEKGLGSEVDQDE